MLFRSRGQDRRAAQPDARAQPASPLGALPGQYGLRDFGRVDIHRGLARALGLEPSYRRAQLWRDIKLRVHELVDTKQVTPLWIIDEAQNLPAEFFRDFPAFLQLSL